MRPQRVSQFRDLDGKDIAAAVQAVPRTALVEYATPTTGFNVTPQNTTNSLVLEPAGTLATGTVTMPAAPGNNQVLTVASTAIITALTIAPNAGQAVKGLLTTIAANGFASWVYRAANSTWYRIA